MDCRIILTAFFTVLLSVYAQARDTGTGDMRFEADSLDLGTVDEDGGPAAGMFFWHNDSDKDVPVLMVKTTCACLEAFFDRGSVAPGDSVEVRLLYRPKGHPGRFSHRVFVYTGLSGSAPSSVLTVTGNVKPSPKPVWQYRFRAGDLLLRRDKAVFSGDMPQVERIMCMNSGGTDMRLSVREGLPECLSFRCEPEVLSPSGTGDLVIGLDPGKASGKLPEEIVLYLDGAGAPADSCRLVIKIGMPESEDTAGLSRNNE